MSVTIEPLVQHLREGLTFREVAESIGVAVPLVRAVFEAELGLRELPAPCAACVGRGIVPAGACKRCGGSGIQASP